MSGLRARSPKMEKLYRTQRRPLVAALLAERSICPVEGCTNEATSPHEPFTRGRGGSIVDPENVVAVCWHHNQNPPDGLLQSSEDARHGFAGAEFLCTTCGFDWMSWRHR